MAYNFTTFKEKVSSVQDWLKNELSGIRTGQATITLLDGVLVDVYGAKTPLNQSANINIEDPKTIRVSPWDKGIIQDIEKAITVADLGVSTSVDDDGLRVIFPDLTTETRERLVKQAKTKTEEAKVSIRNERNKVSKEIESEGLSDDDAKRAKDEMQKIVDEAVTGFEEKITLKETEILG